MVAVTQSGDWRGALNAELVSLNRWAEGRYVPVPGPDDEVVAAEEYTDPDALLAAVVRSGAIPWPPGAELPAAASDNEEIKASIAVSRFSRQYTSPLTLIAAAGLVHGVGIDLSPRHCRMIVFANTPFKATLDVEDATLVRCAERPTDWPVHDGPTVATMDDLRAFVWEKLYGEHLGPLFERIHEVTRVSHNVVWTNAAEWWGMASDAAVEYLPGDAAQPFVEERRAILESPTLPGVDGPNPLANRLAWEPTGRDAFPAEIHTRHTCCICYLLVDRVGRLCQNCPFLGFDDRVALILERHDVAMGTPGGAAEQRAIAQGLEKMSLTTKGAS